MDTSVYYNIDLARATLSFVRRLRVNNPALWERIKAEAAQQEAETLAALQAGQDGYTDRDMQWICEGGGITC